MDEQPRFSISAEDGPHYERQDDGTWWFVNGPVDMSKVNGWVPDSTPRAWPSGEWPAGWVEIGATDD